MGFLDVFAWVVLALIVGSGVAIVALMGMWPGKVAHERNHPQAEAIAVGGWLTLFLGFVFWPLMVVWAYTKSPQQASAKAEESAL
jgi:prepilin signal peptidase PulO-like enzyme (type II secretory pathway)